MDEPQDSGVKKPCPQCRELGKDKAGDNLHDYGEGKGVHCFACGYHENGSDSTIETAKISKKLKKPIIGRCRSLTHRHINDKTCRLYDYRMAKVGGEVVEVENYYRDGEIKAQHIRGKGKDFRWRGDTSDLPMFGQWLWSGKGKRIIVTEGAIDCMTISMLQGNRWPVVSIPSGVNHAPKAIKTNLTFLTGYDEVVLCFDNDEAGRTAAVTCAELLPAGKVRIAHTPRKDANEHLLKKETQPLLTALYEAKTYQPDGILHVSDINDSCRADQKMMLFPWDNLTKTLMGQRSGEITLWASGTGSGKSTVIRELALNHLQAGRIVGMLMLEESPIETLDDLIALQLNKPVRQIRGARELNKLMVSEGRDALDFGWNDDLTDEEYYEAKNEMGKYPLYIYDHHGSNEFGNILQRIDYMATALQCDVIFVDHITAIVAGMTRSGSEREDIDKIMKSLRSTVERTGIHLDLVSQLNRLDGKAAEEGGQISTKNLRGSGSLGTVPNNLMAIERNQQAEDPEERRIIKVRSLKGRFTGETGIAGYLKFNPETRRLEETEWTGSFTEEHKNGESFTDKPEEPGEDLTFDGGEEVLNGITNNGVTREGDSGVTPSVQTTEAS